MSKDDDSVKIFHELRDNKGPTVILTKIKKRNIIGGFTSLSWDCSSNEKCDLESFLFSLTDSLKFPKTTKTLQSIYRRKNYGAWFFNFGFGYKTQKNTELYVSDISAYQNGNEIIPNKSLKQNYFEVEELEVYKIKF